MNIDVLEIVVTNVSCPTGMVRILSTCKALHEGSALLLSKNAHLFTQSQCLDSIRKHRPGFLRLLADKVGPDNAKELLHLCARRCDAACARILVDLCRSKPGMVALLDVDSVHGVLEAAMESRRRTKPNVAFVIDFCVALSSAPSVTDFMDAALFASCTCERRDVALAVVQFASSHGKAFNSMTFEVACASGFDRVVRMILSSQTWSLLDLQDVSNRLVAYAPKSSHILQVLTLLSQEILKKKCGNVVDVVYKNKIK
jgi:hypothetical protein